MQLPRLLGEVEKAFIGLPDRSYAAILSSSGTPHLPGNKVNVVLRLERSDCILRVI